MYEPKIEFLPGGVLEPRKGPGYWVTGIPMPGERVVVMDPHAAHDRIETVRNLWVGIDTCSGAGYHVESLRPYDPDAERLRVATEAVERVCGDLAFQPYEDIARAVLDALKEVDDG